MPQRFPADGDTPAARDRAPFDVPGRVDLDRPDAYGRSFADVYDRWYAEVTDADATADFVAARTTGGPVLELGVGSGRLAMPLLATGCDVIGVDGSAAMLDRVPTPPDGTTDPSPALHLVQADMRALPFACRFDVVLVAFNTLFNLTDETEQADLLTDVARLLGPSGALVIEALDASPLLDGPPDSVGVRTVDEDGVVVTATQLDGDRQTMNGQHLEIRDAGVLLRPWRLRWLTPDQLDRLARDAGLTLIERFGGWDETPFTEASETHVSVYRPTPTNRD